MKILIVTRGVLTNTLGSLKVHYDLKKEYEKQGHLVDVLDYSTLYPKGENAYTKIFGKFYTYKFWRYLQKIAYKYDVIDTNYETITYPKESFGFKGVLLARSHGILPLYLKAQEIEGYKRAFTEENKNIKFKTRIGNIYRFLQKKPGLKEFIDSVKVADLIHCLNEEEYRYFLDYGILKEKILLIPNGLPDNFIQSLNEEKSFNKENSLSFIGSWTFRKGIKDFNNILTIVREKIDIKYFFLLGGYAKREEIENDFSIENQKVLKIIPEFKQEQLPFYLNTCKVGLFPSYAEGFGFAVVEQLAYGIPVVAYKVPGPIDILKNLDESLLIEPGNQEAFANKVIEILQLDEKAFHQLSENCKQESKVYMLSNIAKRFLNVFELYLEKLNKKGTSI